MINRLQETNGTDEVLAKSIIGLAMKVHRTLGCGFVESVYANALALELKKSGIEFEREKSFPVFYDGIAIGSFYADIVVEKRLILELKSSEGLSIAHSIQLVNYLAAAKLDLGLLINFGNKSLEFKTKTRVYHSDRPPLNL